MLTIQSNPNKMNLKPSERNNKKKLFALVQHIQKKRETFHCVL